VKRRSLGEIGIEVSEIGFGASPLGSVYGAIREQDGIAAVRTALELGINFIDVSPYYGSTTAETVLGKALRGVDRDSYVLATKVGRYGDTDFDFSAARVKRSVQESLARLGTDHLDVIQCHDIEFVDLDQIITEALPALRALQHDGLVRAVGITGYPLAALAYVAERAPVDTIMSYCQYTLQDQRLAPWSERFAELGTGVINASPLAMGALTSRGAPLWHPASARVLELCARAAELCHARGTELAKLAVQFAVSTGPFCTTVIGSADPANVRRTVAWASETLDEELLVDVERVLLPVRDIGWVNGRAENQSLGDER
jgi:L-galactose dehydrogenase